MTKKLYLVRSVNQITGTDIIMYCLARDLQHLESEIADIVQIQPLTNFEDLTEEEIYFEDLTDEES